MKNGALTPPPPSATVNLAPLKFSSMEPERSCLFLNGALFVMLLYLFFPFFPSFSSLFPSLSFPFFGGPLVTRGAKAPPRIRPWKAKPMLSSVWLCAVNSCENTLMTCKLPSLCLLNSKSLTDLQHPFQPPVYSNRAFITNGHDVNSVYRPFHIGNFRLHPVNSELPR